MKLNDYEIKHNRTVRELAPECTLFLKYDGSFPLEKAGEIALFGGGARDTLRGGTGSGDVYSRFSVSIEDGLKNAGFSVTSKKWLDDYQSIKENERKKWLAALKKANRGLKGIMKMMGQQMPEPYYELPLDYPGDTAVYVLSRISGEGADRKAAEGDVSLSRTEIRDILYLNARYERFVLVLNVGGVIDLSPVSEVKNILLISQIGALTGDIFADLLLGKSYPSGKLTTTWAKADDYCKVGSFGEADEAVYKEGIYVGYRYFDSVGKAPLYPFGFGLSYTDFEINKESVNVNGRTVTVCANVKNTGSFRGREVVQLYVSVPEEKLDQPYQTLAAFTKTPELRAGESCVVELRFDMDELASYDTDSASYILEKGEYVLRLGNSSRNTEAIAKLALDGTVTVRRGRNVLGDPGFDDWRPEGRAQSDAAALETIPVSASAFKTEEVVYAPVYEIDPFVQTLSDEELCYINIGSFSKGFLNVVGSASKKVAGAAGDFTSALVSKGFPCIVTADGPAGLRISKKYVIDKNRTIQALGNDYFALVEDFLPGVVNKFLSMVGRKAKKGETVYEQYCTMIPVGTALAQSFNLDLAEQFGDLVGEEMERFHVNFWLAPAINIHRTIFCGRNFEYYSEDPFLTGKTAAAIAGSVQKHPGCAVTIKHFAANSQETNRAGNNSRVSERTMREIYLKAFGICVRESHPLGIMTSYNLLNGTHTSERRGLIEDILRCEFGYTGIVMTDWVVDMIQSEGRNENPVSWKIAKAGGDVMMPGRPKDYDALLEGLKNGSVSREQLEINATRMYRMARRLSEAEKR